MGKAEADSSYLRLRLSSVDHTKKAEGKMRITLFALALLLSGCASAGTNYSETAAAAVRVGMSESELVGLLGRPNGRSTLPDGRVVLVWLHSQANGFTGQASARSVSYILDPSGHVMSGGAATHMPIKY